MNGSQENSDSYALIAAWMMSTFHNDDVHERYKIFGGGAEENSVQIDTYHGLCLPLCL